MYWFLKKHKNINDFKVMGDDLYFKSESNLLKNGKETTLTQLPILTRNNIKLFFYEKKIKRIFKDDKLLIEFENELNFSYNSLNTFENNQNCIGSKISFDSEISKIVNEEKGIYNIKTSKKIKPINAIRTSSYFYNNKDILILIENKTILISYNLPEATPKWNFSLEPLGTYSNKFKGEEKPYEIGHFIGVWQNELLIACKGSLILSLDIATGKEFRRWQNLPNTIDDFLKDVFESKIPDNEYIYHLNNTKDCIIAYFLSYQLHINLASGNITITNYKEALAEKNIEHFQYKNGYAEDDTHLYTTVNYDGKALGLKYTPTGIIAFNKLKGTVDWDFRFDTIKGDYISTQVPQYANGKLYQLTQDKNLYIFEKEILNI